MDYFLSKRQISVNIKMAELTMINTGPGSKAVAFHTKILIAEEITPKIIASDKNDLKP